MEDPKLSLRELVASPKFIRKVNGWFVFVWLLLVLPTLLIWSKSVLWVALLSIWANVISHYTAWMAARVEVRAENIENEEINVLAEKAPESILKPEHE